MQTELRPGQRVMVEAVVDKPDGRETVKVTMAYKSNGRITEQVVSGISTERVHPLPADGGWRRNPDYGTNKFTSNLSCGDRILVAVPLSKSSGGGYDIHLIIPTESGFNDADGDYWGTWSWDDVEYYMTLPSPPQAEGGAA